MNVESGFDMDPLDEWDSPTEFSHKFEYEPKEKNSSVTTSLDTFFERKRPATKEEMLTCPNWPKLSVETRSVPLRTR